MFHQFQYFNTEEERWKAVEAKYIAGVGDADHLSNRLKNRINIVAAINSIIDRPLGLPPGLQEQDPDLWETIQDMVDGAGATWDPETGMLIPQQSWDDLVNDFFDGEGGLNEFLDRLGIDNVRESYDDAVQTILRKIDFVPDLLEAVRGVEGTVWESDQQDDDERFMRSLSWLMNNGRDFAQGETVFDVHRDQIDMRITQREATFTHGMSMWNATQYDILRPQNYPADKTPIIERPRLQDLTSSNFRLRARETEMVHDGRSITTNRKIDTGEYRFTTVNDFGLDRNYTRYIEGAFVRFSTNIHNDNPTALPVFVDFTASGAFAFYQNNSRLFGGGKEDVVSGNVIFPPGWSTLDVIIYVPEGIPSFSLGATGIGPTLNTLTEKWEGGQVHQMSAHRGDGKRIMAMEAGINVALDRIGIEINQAEQHDGIITIKEGSIITEVDRIRLFVGEELLNQHTGNYNNLESHLALAPGSIILETLNQQVNPSNLDWNEDILGPMPPLPTLNLAANLIMHDGNIRMNSSRLMTLGQSIHMNESTWEVDWSKITGSVMERILDVENNTHLHSMSTLILDSEMFETRVTQRTIDILEGKITDIDSVFKHGVDGWFLSWVGREFDELPQTITHMQALFKFDPETHSIQLGTLIEQFNNFSGGYDSLEAAIDLGPNGAGVGATIRQSIINAGIQNLIGGTGNNGREHLHGWKFTGGYTPPHELPEDYNNLKSFPLFDSVSGHGLRFLYANNRTGITRPILADLTRPTIASIDGSYVPMLQEYTFQVWIRADVINPISIRVGILNLPGGNVLTSVGREWVKVTHTFSFVPIKDADGKEITKYDFSMLVESFSTLNTQIEHHGLMFNQGAILPNWQPSTADTASQANRINMLGDQMNNKLDNLFSDGNLTPAEKQILRREFETIYYEREDIRKQYMVMRDLANQIHNDLEDEDKEKPTRNKMEQKLNISDYEMNQINKSYNLRMIKNENNEKDDEWITPDLTSRGLEEVFIESKDGEQENHDELDEVYHLSLEDGEGTDQTYFIRNNDVLGQEQYRFESLWDILEDYIGDHKVPYEVKEVVDHPDGKSEEIIINKMMPVIETTSYDVNQEEIRIAFNTYFDAKSQLAMAINERLDEKIEHTREEMADISSFLAESRTIWTGDSIMNIVSGTELWTDTVNGQLTANDLSGFMTEEVMREFLADIPYELRGELTALDNDIRNLETRTKESTNNLFRNAGGVNFIQNSVGMVEFEHWKVPNKNNLSVIRSTGMSDMGRNTAFRYSGSWTGDRDMIQILTTTPGQTYSIGFLSRRHNMNTGFTGIHICNVDSEGNRQEEISRLEASSTIGAWVANEVTFQAKGTRTEIVLRSNNGINIDFTSIMMNVGQIALSWTPHLTEVYSTNVVLDSNGIEVRQSRSSLPTLVTQMSPSRFAVMTRTTSGNNITNIESFRAQGDGLTARNVRVRDSIWLRSGNDPKSTDGIMITPNAGGWSFIPSKFDIAEEQTGLSRALKSLKSKSIMDNWLDMEGEVYL